ncbi:MAG: N-acetylmuramoyl-L-alanine amidase [Sciscionella sp.]|nr:N-acetylmuramoyl-L-alanine amidase [Sciscionella sp.]
MSVFSRTSVLIAGSAAALVVGLVPAIASASGDAPAVHPSRQAEFASAAREFGVPEGLLLAVSYAESLWEEHAGAPSTSGTYGLMGLAGTPTADPGKGDDSESVSGQAAAQPSAAVDTVASAAKLINAPASSVRTDEVTNIRAGAALLAHDERTLTGSLPANLGDWYPAVAEYFGSPSAPAASAFADQVYQTLATGATRTTIDGQRISLPSTKVTPNKAGMAKLALTQPTATTQRPECPSSLHCDFIPAAYAETKPGDPTAYGNYDLANRPVTMKINTIVLHDTEETYPDTISSFEDPTHYASANYVVRSSDGHVTQMVPDKDVAWHAGNWYVNAHAVGIEQEGFAVQGATWFTPALYHSTAALVRYLAARYNVPLDRQHIIGHDNVPGTIPSTIAGMHWDPGPYWDWAYFMQLVGAPIRATAPANSHLVTIDPKFASNINTVRDCDANKPLPNQPSSFVYLHTNPSDSAPLVADPELHPSGAGTDCASDWGDKASVGQQFVVARRSGDWTGIWWQGAIAWFHNPGGSATVPTSGFVVKPKAGKGSIPTYGRAYPEASAYPKAIPAQPITPLPYTIAAGQEYALGGPVPTDYYYAPTIDSSRPDDHTDVRGGTKYLEIQLGHRVGYVLASDVDIVGAH